jgi:hypothetical protein
MIGKELWSQDRIVLSSKQYKPCIYHHPRISTEPDIAQPSADLKASEIGSHNSLYDSSLASVFASISSPAGTEYTSGSFGLYSRMSYLTKVWHEVGNDNSVFVWWKSSVDICINCVYTSPESVSEAFGIADVIENFAQ